VIRLQFVCENALSSRTIAWFSAGHFSHVDAAIPSGELLGARANKVGTVQAGVWPRPFGYSSFSRRVVFSIPAKPTQQRRFYTFLEQQIAKPYDHDAIWGFMLNRDWREQDSWICSELQAAALEAAGILPPLYLAANKITPVALALAVSALGATAQDYTFTDLRANIARASV